MRIITIILLAALVSACAGPNQGMKKSPCACNNNLPEIANAARPA